MNLPLSAVPALVAAAMLSATGCTNDLRTPPGDPTDADSLTSAPAVTDEARRTTQQLPNATQMVELTLPQGSRPGADLLSDAMLDSGSGAKRCCVRQPSGPTWKGAPRSTRASGRRG